MQRISILVLSCLLISACSLVRPFRVDINQGNVVEQAQIDQLEAGMTKRQVQFVMGTPLLVDPFHLQRWDYVYSIKEGYNPRVQRRVSLYFDGERLARMDGDLEPETAEPLEVAAEAEAERNEEVQRVMELLNR
jgi:outer membrane protein assembly factor BamE